MCVCVCVWGGPRYIYDGFAYAPDGDKYITELAVSEQSAGIGVEILIKPTFAHLQRADPIGHRLAYAVKEAVAAREEGFVFRLTGDSLCL